MTGLELGRSYPLYHRDDGSFILGLVHRFEGKQVWLSFEDSFPNHDKGEMYCYDRDIIEAQVEDMEKMRGNALQKCFLLRSFHAAILAVLIAQSDPQGRAIAVAALAQLGVCRNDLLRELLRRQPLAIEIEASIPKC